MFDEIYWYGQYKVAELAMNKLLGDYEFDTVLDLGCGDGKHSKIFCENGKTVTAIDYGKSPKFDSNTADMFDSGG